MKLSKIEFTNLRYLHDKYESEKDRLVEVLCNKLVKSYENINDDLKGDTAVTELHEKAKQYLGGQTGLRSLFGIVFPKGDPDSVTLTFIHTSDKGYQWPIGYTFKLDD